MTAISTILLNETLMSDANSNIKKNNIGAMYTYSSHDLSHPDTSLGSADNAQTMYVHTMDPMIATTDDDIRIHMVHTDRLDYRIGDRPTTLCIVLWTS